MLTAHCLLLREWITQLIDREGKDSTGWQPQPWVVHTCGAPRGILRCCTLHSTITAWLERHRSRKRFLARGAGSSTPNGGAGGKACLARSICSVVRSQARHVPFTAAPSSPGSLILLPHWLRVCTTQRQKSVPEGPKCRGLDIAACPGQHWQRARRRRLSLSSAAVDSAGTSGHRAVVQLLQPRQRKL